MNYAKEVIKSHQTKIRNIAANMATYNLFPDRNEPTKTLDLGYELILKITYSLRTAFLEEMNFIFAYCYSKSKFEKIIQDLEQQGYIVSSISRDYGKYWCLSPIALHYFYNNHLTENDKTRISEDKLPSTPEKLYLSKIINGYFAKTVFHAMTNTVYRQYKAKNMEYRKNYQKEQYIKGFVYTEQGQKTYSKKEASEFVKNFMNQLENEEEYKKYKKFVSVLKENASDDFYMFNYLKDYYNSHIESRTFALLRTKEMFYSIFNNIYRDNYYKYRQKLYSMSNNSERLAKEQELFAIDEALKIFRLNRKNVLNSSKNDKTSEELQELLKKAEDLENASQKFQIRKDDLEEDFAVMLFEKYGTTDFPIFQEHILTLESLKNVNVYIINAEKQDTGKVKLTFGIFKHNRNELTVEYLFSRIEKIFKFYRNNLIPFDYDIKVICHSKKEADLIQTKLKTVRESFEELSEYALLLLNYDNITVEFTERHFRERFEAFNQLKPYI